MKNAEILNKMRTKRCLLDLKTWRLLIDDLNMSSVC